MPDSYGRPSLTFAGVEVVWIGWRSDYPLVSWGRFPWTWRLVLGPLDLRAIADEAEEAAPAPRQPSDPARCPMCGCEGQAFTRDGKLWVRCRSRPGNSCHHEWRAADTNGGTDR